MKKRDSLLIVEAVLYVFAAVGVFYFVYLLGNVVGSLISYADWFQHFPYLLPLVLCSGLPVYLLFAFHAYRHSLTPKGAAHGAITNGLVGVVLAAFALIYAFVLLYNGTYEIGTNYPTAFFPIDVIVYLLLEEFAFLALYLLGVWTLRRPKFFEPLPTLKKGLRGLYGTLLGGAAFLALYASGGVLFSFGFGFSDENPAILISFYLLCLILTAGLVLYECDLVYGFKANSKKISFYSYLGLSVFVLVFFYAARYRDPMGFVEITMPFLAVDYMTSLALFPALADIFLIASNVYFGLKAFPRVREGA